MSNELKELGEDTEGMIESVPKLREEILALSGVDIILDEDTFKSTYQILDELSLKWQELSDVQRAAITEDFAGKNRANIFNALMSNFDQARAALETSQNAYGSAIEEHEKWMQSLEAKTQRLQASLQSLSQTVLDSNFLKGLVDSATQFIDILDVVIDKVGVLPTMIGGVTVLLSATKGVGELIKQFHYLITLRNEYAHEALNTNIILFVCRTNGNMNEISLYPIGNQEGLRKIG